MPSVNVLLASEEAEGGAERRVVRDSLERGSRCPRRQTEVRTQKGWGRREVS